MSSRAEVAEAIVVMGGACALAFLLACLLTNCNAQVGPFVPPGSPVCNSDADCPEGQHCAFPAPGWKARCMTGSSDIDSPPDMARRPDAGP